MADRSKSEIVAKMCASSVAGLNAHAWNRLAGGDPFRQPCIPCRARRFGGTRARWTPAPISMVRAAPLICEARPSNMCSTMAGPKPGRGPERATCYESQYFTPGAAGVAVAWGAAPQHLLAAIEGGYSRSV